jgi:hypothetical protein
LLETIGSGITEDTLTAELDMVWMDWACGISIQFDAIIGMEYGSF